MRTTLLEKPAGLPVDWATVQHHLRLEEIDPTQETAEQTYCMMLAAAATNGATSILRRALLDTVYEADATVADVRLAGDYASLTLDWPNLLAVESVMYGDAVLVADTDYKILTTSDGQTATCPGTLLFQRGLFGGWPCGCCGCGDAPLSDIDAVRLRVQYRAGYGTTPEDVPENIRSWILLRTGALYAQREEAVDAGNLAVMPFMDHLLTTERWFQFS